MSHLTSFRGYGLTLVAVGLALCAWGWIGHVKWAALTGAPLVQGALVFTVVCWNLRAATPITPLGPEPVPSRTTATVRIFRPGGVWRDRARRYRVYADGRLAGRIGPGRTLEIPVEPGRHRLLARMDMLGSPALDVDVSDETPAELLLEPDGGLFAFWRGEETGCLRWTAVTSSPASRPS